MAWWSHASFDYWWLSTFSPLPKIVDKASRCAMKHAFVSICTYLRIWSMQNTQTQTKKHGKYLYMVYIYTYIQGSIYAHMPCIYTYMVINALALNLCYIYICSVRPHNTTCKPLVLQEATVSMAQQYTKVLQKLQQVFYWETTW